ncbi:T cell receptor alpha variable 3 [Synchiropus splendidus]|uniref:T cell receptor alpha variable 3 n=1 Tax=Synchiropus splendidus TaxID=270530 RepID=UPI00237DBE82|nr:T cell receptor alpha variable 3 [Synchiropus splendidus]
MLRWFCSMFVVLDLLSGVCVGQLTLAMIQESYEEGSAVMLSCTISPPASNEDWLSWYRQHPGGSLEHLISLLAMEKEVMRPGLTAGVTADRNQMELKIESAAVTDSAVYFCALRPTRATADSM